MKYTEKIGNSYLTYEGKDLKKYAPDSFFDLIFMSIGGILMCFIFLFIFFAICFILGWILNLFT
jgi:hypothetical protein